MSRLLLLSRGGVLVVSGYVSDVSEDSVTIENDVVLPISGRTEKRKIRMGFPSQRIRNMKLSAKPDNRSFVIATVMPTFGLDILADNQEEDDTALYETKAYNVRYTGAFDFETSESGQKEAHVICGAVRDIRQAKGKDRVYTIVNAVWRRNGKEVMRKLMIPSGKDSYRNIRRGVFVTGPVLRAKDGSAVYPVRSMDVEW